MVDHTWGVDKSLYDSPYGTAQIVSEGFGFMTHKAGGDKADPEIGTWWGDAKPHRKQILLGAYWVLYPNHGSAAGDAFVARLDDQCPGWRDGPFILQLDCEEWGGDPGTMPDVGEIRACANRLRQLAPKLVPIVYAPRWAYGNSLTGLGYPLWSSSYTSKTGTAAAIYPGDSYSGWAAYSEIVPSIAQFSSTCTVAGDSTTDVNCFKGTVPELVALLAPGFVGDLMDWTDRIGDTEVPSRTYQDRFIDDAKVRGVWVGYAKDADVIPANAPIKQVINAAALIVNGMTPMRTDVAAMKADIAAIKAQLTAGVPAQVDTQALATALSALLPDVEINEQTLIQAFRDMANAAPTPVGNQTPAFEPQHPGLAGSETPIHDEAADELTKRMRQARQPGIQDGR